MEKRLKLKAEVRKHVGSKGAGLVRQQGRIPAVIYGHKQEPVAVSLGKHDLTEGIHHGHRFLDVQIGTKSQSVLVKDLQYDHLGKDIIHADLMRVDVAEKVKVTVPIELKGTAKGTHMGGIVEEHLDHLEIECKVSDIPDRIVVRVTDVDVGDNLHAGDVELPEEIKLVTNPSALILTCSLLAVAKTAEEIEEEAPVAPEVIGEAEEGEEAVEKEQ